MIIPSSRVLWLMLAAGSAALVVSSLVLTVWLNLHPCHLCIFQRLLFMWIALLALGAGLSTGVVRRVAGILVALAAAGGAAVATYQSWLQAQPPGSISCVEGQPGGIERLVEWLGAQVPALFLATGFCEEEELVILGLSLANWALVCFVAMLALALWLVRSTGWRPEARPPQGQT
jgi:disulfide bond formation protein DsbB